MVHSIEKEIIDTDSHIRNNDQTSQTPLDTEIINVEESSVTTSQHLVSIVDDPKNIVNIEVKDKVLREKQIVDAVQDISTKNSSASISLLSSINCLY